MNDVCTVDDVNTRGAVVSEVPYVVFSYLKLHCALVRNVLHLSVRQQRIIMYTASFTHHYYKSNGPIASST